MKRIMIYMSVFLLLCVSCVKERHEFTVLQWNIWQEGTMLPGGYDAIVNEIVRLKPDFVTLSEVRNYHNSNFTAKLTASLKEKGLDYYSFYSYDSGLLSRYPITDSVTIFPENEDHGSIYKMMTSIHGKQIAVYTAHLDYLNDAYYNVRGYDGSTWEEIPIPESVEEIMKINVTSQRDDAIKAFLKAAEEDKKKGNLVILGGDFNEPSHLDWTDATKDLYCHNGFVIPWTVTTLLDSAGFVDTYRSFYPNPVDNPGITFPDDNPGKEVEKLTWTPKSDERERIDYIFYLPQKGLSLKDVVLFGHEGSIAYNQRVPNETKDKFILPLGVWPTDHKGLLATFEW